MVTIRIQVCLISARGLRRSLSLMKPQWYAVGWVDPNNKYCTKIDSSGSSNPAWRTKFSVVIDDTNSNLKGMSLMIEVYRRDPIFLREKLQGTATVSLKEFFIKFAKDREVSGSGVEEAGSFQLRKRSSGKPQGFVDISVSISEEREGVTPNSGIGEGNRYTDSKNEIQLAIEDGPVLSFPTQPQLFGNAQFGRYLASRPVDYPNSSTGYHRRPPLPPPPPPPPTQPQLFENGQFEGYPASRPGEYLSSTTGYHRQPPPPPPPPPPPSNPGYLPNWFRGTSQPPPETYVNLPPRQPTGQRSGPGFRMGLGAGALAAGAVIFGDDFMSGSTFPMGLEDGSLAVSTDPPF